MSKIIVTTRSGEIQELAAEPGVSVMEIIRDGGIDDLPALCGGSCSCATCHIYVDPAQQALLAPAGEVESDLLSGSDHRNDASRLSCQLVFAAKLDGLRVTIAPEG